MGKREVPNTWISILRANYRTLQFIDLFLLQYHTYISELYQGVTVEGFKTKKKERKILQNQTTKIESVKNGSIPCFSIHSIYAF